MDADKAAPWFNQQGVEEQFELPKTVRKTIGFRAPEVSEKVYEKKLLGI